MIRRKQIEKLIYILLTFYLVVDTINGILIREYSFSISVVYKSIIMLGIVFYLRQALWGWAIFVVLTFYLVIHYFLNYDILLSLSGLNWMIKFAGIVLYYLFFTEIIKNYKTSWVLTFSKFSFGILALNLLFGLFGLGYSQYAGAGENTIGSRGFIYAGNEMGTAIVVSAAIIMMFLIEDGKYLKYILFSVFFIFTTAILTSKTGVISSLLLLLLFPVFKVSKKLSKYRINIKDFYFSTIVVIIFPFVLFFGVYYALYESNLIIRLQYFYERVDLLTLIMSNRNIWFLEAKDIFINEYNIFQVLFGDGIAWFIKIYANKSVEIDSIDFLMTYGFSGVILVCLFFFSVLAGLFLNKKNNPYFYYLFFMLFLIFVISNTAGHVINSGISGPILGALFALVNYRKEYEKKDILSFPRKG